MSARPGGVDRESGKSSEIVSGADFLAELDKVWGGPLHIALPDQMADQFSNIRANLQHALDVVSERVKSLNPQMKPVIRTSNPAADFRQYLVQEAPHPDRAGDHVHMLACPFCRGALLNRVDEYLRAASKDAELHSITEDVLPFPLGMGEWVTQSPLPATSSIEERFAYFKQSSETYAERLHLTGDARKRFLRDFEHEVDELQYFVERVDTENIEGVHLMFQIESRSVYIKLLFADLAATGQLDDIGKEASKRPPKEEDPRSAKERYTTFVEEMMIKETLTPRLITPGEMVEFIRLKLNMLTERYGFQDPDKFAIFERALYVANQGNNFLIFVLCWTELRKAENMDKLSLFISGAKAIREDGFFHGEVQYHVIDMTLTNHDAMREIVSHLGLQVPEELKKLFLSALNADEIKTQIQAARASNLDETEIAKLENEYKSAEAIYLAVEENQLGAAMSNAMEFYLAATLNASLLTPDAPEDLPLSEEDGEAADLLNVLEFLHVQNQSFPFHRFADEQGTQLQLSTLQSIEAMKSKKNLVGVVDHLVHSLIELKELDWNTAESQEELISFEEWRETMVYHIATLADSHLFPEETEPEELKKLYQQELEKRQAATSASEKAESIIQKAIEYNRAKYALRAPDEELQALAEDINIMVMELLSNNDSQTGEDSV
jgi:hypothetical protein